MKKVKRITVIALLAAVIAVVAPFSAPAGVVPISLATLAVYVAAQSVDWKAGTAAVLIYILLGAVGVPVFSGFRGGAQHIFGVTGGFIIGYILCAMVSGLIADKLSGKHLKYFIGNISGAVVCYACGMIWFSYVTKTGFAGTAAACVLPFLPGEAIKIIIASLAAPKFRKAINKQKTAY